MGWGAEWRVLSGEKQKAAFQINHSAPEPVGPFRPLRNLVSQGIRVYLHRKVLKRLEPLAWSGGKRAN